MASADEKKLAEDVWGAWGPNLRDRAMGVIVAGAVGDALGAAHAGVARADDEKIDLEPGNVTEKGEWEDTCLSIPILEALARGEDLLSDSVQGKIVARWLEYYASGPKGIGQVTNAVLEALSKDSANKKPSSDADYAELAKKSRHAAENIAVNLRASGKGSLVRTAPVALAYLYDTEHGTEKTAQAARAISALTHDDSDAGDACSLWAVGIRHTLLTGQPNLVTAFSSLPDKSRDQWQKKLLKSEAERPHAYSGWSVATLQAAWAAIWQGYGMRNTLELAAKAGGDGVGCVSGAFAGGVFGDKEVPDVWRTELHGWPGWTAWHLEKETEKVLQDQTEKKRNLKK